jgi:hypothetical protein
MLRQLQHFPQDEEVLAFEAGCKEYCKREVDEVEWQGDASICTSASGETSAATLGSPRGVPGVHPPGLTRPCCSRLVSRPRRRRSTRPSRAPKHERSELALDG